jgi:hypothetical protein
MGAYHRLWAEAFRKQLREGPADNGPAMLFSTAISNCRAALTKVDTNGNGTVTTVEISRAKKAGVLTAAEAKLLQRVASDIRQGQTVPNYRAQLDLYEASATAADTNHDGVLSKKEATAAADTFVGPNRTVWSNRAMLKKLAAF